MLFGVLENLVAEVALRLGQAGRRDAMAAQREKKYHLQVPDESNPENK